MLIHVPLASTIGSSLSVHVIEGECRPLTKQTSSTGETRGKRRSFINTFEGEKVRESDVDLLFVTPTTKKIIYKKYQIVNNTMKQKQSSYC